jgi:branched-chain amino acid transport system substrate-binding protein
MSISRLPRALYLIFSIAAGIAGPAHAQIGSGAIKIGVITDMNGPLSSATGRGSVEAARMAAEEFGFSINGRPIEILSADHQNKPDIGASIVRQWFDVEHVNVAADIANSAVGFAIVEIARPRNKIRFDWRWIFGLYRKGLCADQHPLDVGYLRRVDGYGESGFRP